MIIVIVLFMFCSTVFNFIPIENYFMNFSSPEQVFNYMYNSDVELVVEGKHSALVIGEDNKRNDSFSIVSKSQDGWKISTTLNEKRKDTIVTSDFLINLIYHKKTDEYYIVVDIFSETSKPLDSCESSFVFFERDSSYYAYISEYNDNYWIEINGNRYTFDKEFYYQ